MPIVQFPIANIEFIEYIHFTPFCPDDQFFIYESLNSLLAWINARSHCLVAFPHCVPRHIHRLLVSRLDAWPSDPLSTFKPSHPRCLQKPLSLSRLISYTLHKLSHCMYFHIYCIEDPTYYFTNWSALFQNLVSHIDVIFIVIILTSFHLHHNLGNPCHRFYHSLAAGSRVQVHLLQFSGNFLASLSGNKVAMSVKMMMRMRPSWRQLIFWRLTV